MERTNKPAYKYCIVPECRNTIRNTPDKVFFLVPRGLDIRRKWCEIIKRDMISPSTCLYCCEDHFDIEQDTDNYIQYKIMHVQHKQKTSLRLKKGVLPHRFECQKTEYKPSAVRLSYLKRKRSETVKNSRIENFTNATQECLDTSQIKTEPIENNKVESIYIKEEEWDIEEIESELDSEDNEKYLEKLMNSEIIKEEIKQGSDTDTAEET